MNWLSRILSHNLAGVVLAWNSPSTADNKYFSFKQETVDLTNDLVFGFVKIASLTRVKPDLDCVMCSDSIIFCFSSIETCNINVYQTDALMFDDAISLDSIVDTELRRFMRPQISNWLRERIAFWATEPQKWKQKETIKRKADLQSIEEWWLACAASNKAVCHHREQTSLEHVRVVDPTEMRMHLPMNGLSRY